MHTISRPPTLPIPGPQRRFRGPRPAGWRQSTPGTKEPAPGEGTGSRKGTTVVSDTAARPVCHAGWFSQPAAPGAVSSGAGAPDHDDERDGDEERADGDEGARVGHGDASPPGSYASARSGGASNSSSTRSASRRTRHNGSVESGPSWALVGSALRRRARPLHGPRMRRWRPGDLALLWLPAAVLGRLAWRVRQC